MPWTYPKSADLKITQRGILTYLTGYIVKLCLVILVIIIMIKIHQSTKILKTNLWSAFSSALADPEMGRHNLFQCMVQLLPNNTLKLCDLRTLNQLTPNLSPK